MLARTTTGKAPAPPRPPKPADDYDGYQWLARARELEWTPRPPPSIWCDTSGLAIPRNAFNAEAGDYHLSRTPYWREIMDLVFEPQVRQIWLYKSTQIGFTRFLICLMMYILAHPDLAYAIGLLMPDEDAVEEIFREEIQPTIDQSPCMRRHRTGKAWDETKAEIWLDTGPILGLYAGSVQRLARRSLRYVFGDEINKYRTFKAEASPIQLLWKRTSNHLHHARGIFGSTPTDPVGNITQGFANCFSKRRYFMPCARCGRYQPWTWGQVKGFHEAPGDDKLERAEWVRQNKPCFYECEFCRGRTEEKEKPAAVAVGRWVSGVGVDLEHWEPVHEVDENGKLSAPHPSAANVGLHAWAIISPWLSMTDLAAEFIEAEADPDKTRDFRNARQALPFHDQVRNVRASIYREKKRIAPSPGTVPKWVVGLYATADTQKDWFALCIRAWGWGFRSQLTYYGTCETFDELYERALVSVFPVDDGSGEVAAAKALLIDSGGEASRTDEVYEFTQRDTRIMAIKGTDARMNKLWNDSEVRPGVFLRSVNVGHFKDSLYRLVHHEDPTLWLPHNEVSEQYCVEMASEHLVRLRGKLIWQKKGSVRNEAWDTEVYQRAAAEMDGIGAAPAPPPESARPIGDPSQYTNPLTSHKGKWSPKKW